MIHECSQKSHCLYRSRTGMIFGVCKGFSEYFGLSLKVLRIFAVLVLLFTGVWPALVIYFLAALLIKPEPITYNTSSIAREMSVDKLKQKFDHLDHRIQRIEGVVTSKEFNWKQRLYSRHS